ncbi:hypothetical protein ACFQFQ_16450 [Sulfitobacter porphyrae]|uniref:Uncharacterized protein n=1 Tax=Sulfitobacter porphyrae TaxID=1246864 RepID=A0ABW2B5P8_9RHOB
MGLFKGANDLRVGVACPCQHGQLALRLRPHNRRGGQHGTRSQTAFQQRAA